MKIKVIGNRHKAHEELLKRNISERIPVCFGEEGLRIELRINKRIGKAESFRISKQSEGYKITGADSEGLCYGIGKFLHTAKWTEKDFEPNPPMDLQTPDSSLRAIYFAIHYNNWYDEAPAEDLDKYLEELLLYGYNAIIGVIPTNGIYSYEKHLFERSVQKLRSMFILAKRLGMKVGIIITSNAGLLDAPHEWDADPSYEQRPEKPVRGHLGRNLCPNIPEALEYLRGLWLEKLERFTDIGIDYFVSWPYDGGGCGCEKCRPWGANGFCDMSIAVHNDIVKYYPDSKFILATWLYDSPDDEGEYSGLYERLKGDMSFVDYIMADSHDTFPKYPLEHEPVKPIINFPEISMWRLVPWGGRGANPQPKRFQAIWDGAKHVLKGGMPYSEGKYEDVLKVQYAGYYWDADKSYKDILGEYVNYEFSGDVIDEVVEMMELMELNHVRVADHLDPDMDAIKRCEQLADYVDAKLGERAKTSWRWRILYIRAKMDRITNTLYFEKYYDTKDAIRRVKFTPEEWLYDNEEAQELMQELCRLYCCVDLRDDKQNAPTLPTVRDGKVIR